MDTTVTVVLMAVFAGLSAFFSSSETAFFALQQVRVHQLVEKGVKGADRLARMKSKPEKFLATILLGNNLANVALSAAATALAITTLGSERQGLSVVIATGFTTIGIVIFGEAFPKTVAAWNPERVLLRFLRPIEILQALLFPLAVLLQWASTTLSRPFSRPVDSVSRVGEEELRMLIQIGARQGTVEEHQARILHKTFEFGDLQGLEIMTPRTEIVFLAKDVSLEEFLKIYSQETHTRFPIYDKEPDNVIGILSVKDVLKAFGEGALKSEDLVGTLMRSAFFYPETIPVDDLFIRMQNQGTQIALLIDEHGGIAGLLTVKQIVGEIVGGITDEDGAIEPEIRRIDERTIQVDASMRVDEANEQLNLGLPDGDYETLAGFVLDRLGHIPTEGEQVLQSQLRLVVTEMKGVKIESLMVTRS